MSLLNIFFAFCGGAFASMVGSLTAFVFTGITCLIGIAAVIAGTPFNWMGVISFGGYFSPAISFAGGAAAAAYASYKGYMTSGKDIGKALIALKKPDVILFGGFVGALGYSINYAFGLIGFAGKVDTVALTIVVIALLFKAIFEKNPVGKLDEGSKKLGRYHVNSGSWQPVLTRTIDKVVYGLIIGGISACATGAMLASEDAAVQSMAAYLPFSISICILLFIMMGIEAPVTHHIVLIASYTMIAGGNIAWGIVGGIIATFLGDFLSRMFYVHGNSHVDPPSLAIAGGSFIVFVIFPKLGLYNLYPDVTPYIIILLFVIWGLIVFFKKENSKEQLGQKITV